MQNRIEKHPILPEVGVNKASFSFEGNLLIGSKDEMISSALIANGIKIFGYHEKDNSPQGIYCANGQCAQCTLIVNDKPVKSCVTPLKEGMTIKRCNGTPKLPEDDGEIKMRDPYIFSTQVLVIGGGPSGLSASQMLGQYGVNVLLIDDRTKLGGKLILQTHKFFGSEKDVYAGKRGMEIANILENENRYFPNVEIWTNSSAVGVFSDGFIGVLKNNEVYALVKPELILFAMGAREKSLIFKGNILPGVYGAGAFQTLVNRDRIKSAEKIFIIGGGNIGLITGYHAIQAGIQVIGLAEALPECSGYKVHEQKLRNLGVPIYTKHTIISANGEKFVNSITIGKLSKDHTIIEGSQKTFNCDSILIAIGLNSINEFYEKAQQYGFKSWICGDAQEISEASAAIFSGKMEAIKILNSLGIKVQEKLSELEKKLNLLKQRPSQQNSTLNPNTEGELFPLFHCDQEIPCNPCTSICPQDQISTIDDIITQLPYFRGEKDCIGCGKCVSICPGLAITLIDKRKDKENPIVTFPFELQFSKIKEGDYVRVMGKDGDIGRFRVKKSRIIKEFPKTQLVSIQLPKNMSLEAISIRSDVNIVAADEIPYAIAPLEDDAIVCRCERVSVGKIKKWIKRGVHDINELKALTKIGMGACGGKTCFPLIESLYKSMGISSEKITQGTVRPLHIEIPMGFFVKLGGSESDD